MERRFIIVCICVVATHLFDVNAAVAQQADQKIIDLNNQAMEAYNNLNVDKAASSLEKALGVAMENGVVGQLLVATHLNLGVVYVGGQNDKQKGLDHFLQACCLDPAAQLDPLVSTPEIQEVFAQAQQMSASGGCGAAGVQTAPPPPPMPVAPPQQPIQPVQPVQPVQPMMPQQPVVPGVAQIFHQPPFPQVSQAPLPLYVEVTPNAGIEAVYVFYSALGMDTFKKAEMIPYGSGFAYQISCRDVWEPRVRYYITAVGDDDQILATAGTAQTPFEALVVTSLQGQPGPALPGSTPPGVCVEIECPPGLSGAECEKPPYLQIGDGCDTDKECQPGLMCADEICMIPGASPGGMDIDGIEKPEKPGTFSRFFFQIGFAVGIASIYSGMLADSDPPQGKVFWNEGDPNPENLDLIPGQFNPYLPWVPDADSWNNTEVDQQPYGATSAECAADGIVTNADRDLTERITYPSRYCARINQPGMVFLPAFRVAVGYFVLPRLSLAGIFRFQFEAGQGTLANMLLGGRVEYLFYGGETARGLAISGFLGASAGQIQAKPPLETQESGLAPFIISGMLGAHIGATVRYRFHKFAGVFFSPEFDFQFPAIMFSGDFTIGAELALF
jgi:hypothetical protein